MMFKDDLVCVVGERFLTIRSVRAWPGAAILCRQNAVNYGSTLTSVGGVRWSIRSGCGPKKPYMK